MNQNLPENQNQNAILQQDELVTDIEHLQQQENGQNEEPAVIPQRNQMQIVNNNRRQRMKWTKQLNTDIIRCYFETIQRIPDQPYRKEFHNRWKEIHPESTLSEQRICDQQRTIMAKVNSRENTRGSWLTELEINQVRISVARQRNIENQIENEPPQEGNESDMNNVNQPDEIIPPVNEGIINQDQANINELHAVRDLLLDAYAESLSTPFNERLNLKKPGRKVLIKLQNALLKVNRTLEDIVLPTEIGDVTNLNHLVYAAAVTAIKIANLEKECIFKKRQNTKRREDWTFNMNRRINDLRSDISKVSQMNDPRPSSKMKRNSNSMRNKYRITDEESRTATLEMLQQRLYALNNRLARYIRRQKQFHQNNNFINKPSKLFDELRGNKITIKHPPNEQDLKNFWQPLYENKKQYNKNAV